MSSSIQDGSMLTTGTCRRLFAKEGYRVALIARAAGDMGKLVDDLSAAGAEVCHFRLHLQARHRRPTSQNR